MKKVPSGFDDIRAMYDEEVAPAVAGIVTNPAIRKLLPALLGEDAAEYFLRTLHPVHSVREFQQNIIVVLLAALESRTCRDVRLYGTENINTGTGHVYMSNHRDIVLDAALLNVHLFYKGFETTQIGIGDNLISLPWVEYAMRLNKSYVVRRNKGVKEQLLISRHLSEYISQVVKTNGEGLWIAQREGRSKDSQDRTQASVLKMLAMAGEGNVAERLRGLHILPVAISYEYDPCDYLKAREAQVRRDTGSYAKRPDEDLFSMKTGLLGNKGSVNHVILPELRIPSEIDDLPRNQQADAIALLIDKAIHGGYRLFATHFAAADLLTGTRDFADRYTAADKERFERYISERLALIDLPGKDEDFLRARLLEMYANPALNQRAALE